jgi:hypothetical protein
MTAAAISFREPVLAWAISPEDEARFRRILRSVLAASRGRDAGTAAAAGAANPRARAAETGDATVCAQGT